MKKYILKYGILAAIIMLVLGTFNMMVLEDVGMEYGMLMGYLAMILAFSMIFIAIKSYRNNELGGVINFGQAFKIGLFISLIVTFVYVTGWLMYYNPSDSTFTDNYIEQTITGMEKAGIDPVEIETQITAIRDQMESYNNSSITRILFSIMEIFPVGLIMSLIAAGALFKKNRKDEGSILDV